jgi:hypothetical protein
MDYFKVAVLLGIALGFIILVLGTINNSAFFDYQMTVNKDLNSSLQLAHSEHQALAGLIVQGALLNKQIDENDLFVQSWKENCGWVQQDQNFAYYACKAGK